MGKHSAKTDSVFWRTLFLSALKWGVISIFPISAAIGGWVWLTNRNGANNAPTDNPVVDAGERTGEPASESSSQKPLGPAQVLNGSGIPALLSSAQSRLKDAGYEVVTTGTASRRYDKTTVFYQAGSRAAAEDLARLAGAAVTDPAPSSLDKNIPLTLVVGTDYKP